MMSQDEWAIRSKWQSEDNAHEDEQYQRYLEETDKDARIADLERQLAEARAVKPLEWAVGMHDRQFARSAVGQYSALDYGGGTIWLDLDGMILTMHPTIEAAKAAAQADFTARILSALKGSTP